MFRISLILLLLFTVSSCSSIKKLEIFSTEIERQPLNLEEPILPKLEPVSYTHLTLPTNREV